MSTSFTANVPSEESCALCPRHHFNTMNSTSIANSHFSCNERNTDINRRVATHIKFRSNTRTCRFPLFTIKGCFASLVTLK